MSDEKLEVVNDLPGTPPAPGQTLALDQLKAGYVVGLTQEGEFVFEPVGQTPGLTEILGLHQYAQIRIGVLADLNQGLVGKMVSDVLKALGEIKQELARQSQAVKKPTNSLK